MKKKLKILIIDYDLTNTPYLVKSLQFSHNCEVTWLSKADNVISYLSEIKFDLIILDTVMLIPKSWSLALKKKSNLGLETGVVLFEQIRKKYPQLPVLIYSSYKNEIMDDEYTCSLNRPDFPSVVFDSILKLTNKNQNLGKKN